MCEIFSKLVILFNLIVNFEQTSYIVLDLPLLTLNK